MIYLASYYTCYRLGGLCVSHPKQAEFIKFSTYDLYNQASVCRCYSFYKIFVIKSSTVLITLWGVSNSVTLFILRWIFLTLWHLRCVILNSLVRNSHRYLLYIYPIRWCINKYRMKSRSRDFYRNIATAMVLFYAWSEISNLQISCEYLSVQLSMLSRIVKGKRIQ